MCVGINIWFIDHVNTRCLAKPSRPNKLLIFDSPHGTQHSSIPISYPAFWQQNILGEMDHGTPRKRRKRDNDADVSSVKQGPATVDEIRGASQDGDGFDDGTSRHLFILDSLIY